MASTTSVPLEQTQARPSFAKVAASAYKPQVTKEHPKKQNPAAGNVQPGVHMQNSHRSDPSDACAPKLTVEKQDGKVTKEEAGNTVTQNRQWANSSTQQVVPGLGGKDDDSEKPRPSIMLVRPLAAEDSTTQLSSSDGSAKPPSLDGKSVASATTFALDEKESLRPDDSASLRAVEEEDVASPPDSVAAGSRVGSDSGANRAFHDQLHEIAGFQRGAPPGRFPNLNGTSPHTLYDPNQPPNGIGRPMSQPFANGVPIVAGAHNLPDRPDDKLIEALESPRDRLFVLKLEQDFIDFIKDSRENELSLPNCNTFYRMLAHKLADYYLLHHVVDTTLTGVRIIRTPHCRIPPPLSGLPVSSKNGNTPPVDFPARKIMRRGEDSNSGAATRANSEGPSKPTSEAGGANGSDGGNENDGKDKSALTREEREARYREARQRIFGNSEKEDTESTEVVGSGEEKDASRSSSASGKKKAKKHRNYDDDGFEARSRYNVYYPQQYPVPGFGGDNPVYYGGYPGQMQNQQFAGVNQTVSPPPAYNGGYQVMMPQDAQSPYTWSAQQYQAPSGPMAYPGYSPGQNGYDLSNDFQRGMQSFQSSGMPGQVTPKMANAPMASYQDTYQPQPMSMNTGWPQMNAQPSYPMSQSTYAQNGANNRPMSAPLQGPPSGSYPYGQFPPSPFNGKPSRNQHPIPGSFNRQQFNPQSQAFIPGGRNPTYQMQANMAPMPPQALNGYGNFPLPVPNQMPPQMQRPSPPVAHQQTIGSPRSFNSNAVPAKSNGSASAQAPQIVPSQTNSTPSTSTHSNPLPISTQSSIAKWGTPSHLPPKPPPPAQPQPPKFSLPGHSFTSAPRVNTNLAPGLMANPPMLRGAAASNLPNPNSS